MGGTGTGRIVYVSIFFESISIGLERKYSFAHFLNTTCFWYGIVSCRRSINPFRVQVVFSADDDEFFCILRFPFYKLKVCETMLSYRWAEYCLTASASSNSLP